MAEHRETSKPAPPAETAIRATPPAARTNAAIQAVPAIPQVQDTASGGAAELRRLDEEWQPELARHTVLYGKRAHLPSLARTMASVFFGLFLVVAGVFLLTIDVPMGGRGPRFPTTLELGGLFFVLMGVCLPNYHIYRYRIFKQAQQDYLRRRSEVLARLPQLDQ